MIVTPKQTSDNPTPKSTQGITEEQLQAVLYTLDKSKFVAPSSTSHQDKSTPDDRDKKIQELEAKVESLEAQVVGLQGEIGILKKNDDFQLRACKEIARKTAKACHNLDLTDDNDIDDDPEAGNGGERQDSGGKQKSTAQEESVDK
ncbi:hypothetical protein L1987_06406 [Smallanthus sonchifolius]|uniref:Uncharacterized protein n=1 Tax=Smallanthus sonchifolius TaxID=185202 RepID=A0ACB9JY87_9ASTR|nr:hypothetical protein L1987_06406 [Smallanthus sonchifolius]